VTCQEAIEKLAEYLDAELAPEALASFEAHLGICAPCRAYFATYRKTKDLAAKVNRVEMPEELKARLRALLEGG
jgi:anti-sigma factor (TIGR02949 family)